MWTLTVGAALVETHACMLWLHALVQTSRPATGLVCCSSDVQQLLLQHRFSCQASEADGLAARLVPYALQHALHYSGHFPSVPSCCVVCFVTLLVPCLPACVCVCVCGFAQILIMYAVSGGL